VTSQKQIFGQWGEEQAAQYLISQDYEIVDRNVRNEFGELDLIAKKDEQLVFVEVKARRSEDFGFPEEAVTESKKQHILDAAQSYLNEHPQMLGDWRIDVISVQSLKGKLPEIIHFENAFV
jgi:putative endonuclease